MSDTLTFDTTDSDEAVSFWYEFKPFINEKDGSMELDIDHEILHTNELDSFDIKKPQIDPVNLSASMVTTMRKKTG